eukprot:TRINITY_DN1056_c0_g1_i2.p1 TRINITY_DN1056_c0_g1~~TRINITY_DN1056_c0_g1_i2.p1  ORF type:complete len:188 (+),score=24.45 TRINITY_DN1056_c0_g1_i2:82-564(+)
MAGVPPDIVPRVVKLANHGVVRTFSSTGGWGVAVDNNDGAHAYVAYSIKNMVARVSLRDGSAVCVAGIPSSEGFHDGAGSEGLMYWPSGIAVHRSGDIYFCDECNNAIRKITPQGPSHWCWTLSIISCKVNCALWPATVRNRSVTAAEAPPPFFGPADLP